MKTSLMLLADDLANLDYRELHCVADEYGVYIHPDYTLEDIALAIAQEADYGLYYRYRIRP